MKKLFLPMIFAILLPQFAFACSDSVPNYYRLGLVVVLSSLFAMFLAYLAWKKHAVLFMLFGFIFVVLITTFPTC